MSEQEKPRRISQPLQIDWDHPNLGHADCSGSPNTIPTSPLSIEQEADALEALENDRVTPGPWTIEISDEHPDGEIVVRDDPAVTERVFTGFNRDTLELLVALRNRALPLIRALRERVAAHAKSLEEVNALAYKFSERLRFYEPEGVEEPVPPDLRDKILNHAAYVDKLQARIESLEAEQELEYEAHQRAMDELAGAPPAAPVHRFTPAEIQARIAQKRREASSA